MAKEVESRLKKGAIQETSVKKDQFSSNLFLIGKKDGENRPVINLKNLNAFIPYLHFKMKVLHLLKDMLKEKDYLCKIDLKDAYVCVPLRQKHRKYIRFCWEGPLYEFLSKIITVGNPENRIIGSGNRLNKHDSNFANGKSKKFNSEMQKLDGKSQTNVWRNYKLDRFPLLNSTSSNASIFTNKISATTASEIYKKQFPYHSIVHLSQNSIPELI